MKIVIISFVVLLMFVQGIFAEEGTNQNYYTLASCVDSDGDSPSTMGELNYTYNGSGITSGYYNGGNSCSFHYFYVLKYSGEKILWGETILNEHICPSNFDTLFDQPGDIGTETNKFYKCKCKDVEGGEEGKVEGTKGIIGGICTNTPEEIPAKLVFEAEKKWEQDGRPAPGFMTRLLKLLGWG